MGKICKKIQHTFWWHVVYYKCSIGSVLSIPQSPLGNAVRELPQFAKINEDTGQDFPKVLAGIFLCSTPGFEQCAHHLAHVIDGALHLVEPLLHILDAFCIRLAGFLQAGLYGICIAATVFHRRF